MLQPIIELAGVCRSFRTRQGVIPALQDISLAVMPQEVVCLVGESGCGKTTTGKIIAGLLPPSQGEVRFEGQDIAQRKGERSAFRRAVQLIHQDPYASLNPAHSVENILRFPLQRHRVVQGETALQQRIRQLLEMVELTPPAEFVHKFPHQLSGGQRQRVAIARALTVAPRIIVADEPVSMVDVSIRVSLLKTLGRLRDELGIAFVLITHDLGVARHFAWAGRTAVMYLGRIVEIGATAAITQNPLHPYTRALLSAIPEPDPQLTRSRARIQLRSQDIPSPLHLPGGCAFHPRCPWYDGDHCAADTPALQPVYDTGTQVACHPIADGRRLP